MATLRLRLKRINLDQNGLTGPGSPVNAAVERAGKAAVKAVQEATPVRSGRLQDSWEYRIRQTPNFLFADIFVGQRAAGVGTPPNQYVRFVVYGTTGPIVSTTPGKNLKILGLGAPIYRGSVAGQEPNPFPARALKSIRKQNFEE